MKFTLFRDQSPARVEKEIADSIVSGTPQQHAQLMFSGQQDSIKSGVWESTAGVFTAVMQDQIEFCHILEGSATIRTDEGETFTVKAGDGFVMESGLSTEWTVDDFIKKHFVICAV
ncbi:cupin domain-containing protein [Pseudosulfitobacter sp. SM2401]|uniref:cupin domain-containing protein n=1 Tax=Pseudosulfitobacter sp. SM2401 TaxID=3350098 RepID=UPI0036F2095E